MSLQAVYQSDKRVAETTSRMTEVGIGFDKAKAAEFQHLLREKEAAALADAELALGRSLKRTKSGGVSSDDLAKAFFEDLGVPILFLTLTGKPSLSALALEHYAASRNDRLKALAKAESARRRAVKVRATYIEGVKLGADGRVHPGWKGFGTVSGRWAVADPNLANLPRKSNDPMRDYGGIRSLYVPREGCSFVYYDKCLAPDARVLTTDLRWVAIGDVAAGDELVGFDEQLGYSPKMKRSRVLATERLMKPCYRITTDQGVVTCSDNHMWVKRGKYGQGKGSGGSIWAETQSLEVGNRIAFYEKPWEHDTSNAGGWFAGFLDGDGWSTEDWGQRTSVATVTKIEYVGVREVVAIQTETRTFIAEGMLSHNSQIEFRVAAYGSGDDAMIEACEAGDVHSANASILFPSFDKAVYKRLKDSAVTDQEKALFTALDNLRTLAKSSVFAVCYLAEAPTVYERIVASGVPVKLAQVQAMLNALRSRCRIYYQWQAKRLLECVKNGYTTTPILGRRRHLGHEPSPSECANFPIQGGAADVMSEELPRVARAVRAEADETAELVAHVYDSVLIECKEDKAQAVAEVCRFESLKPVTISSSGADRVMVLPIDLEILKRWK